MAKNRYENYTKEQLIAKLNPKSSLVKKVITK